MVRAVQDYHRSEKFKTTFVLGNFLWQWLSSQRNKYLVFYINIDIFILTYKYWHIYIYMYYIYIYYIYIYILSGMENVKST